MLSESAWRHKPAYQAVATMLLRWAKAPGPVLAKAHHGNEWLHARWLGFEARHKEPAISPAGAEPGHHVNPGFAHYVYAAQWQTQDSGVTREGHYEAACSAASSLDSGSALVAEHPVTR